MLCEVFFQCRESFGAFASTPCGEDDGQRAIGASRSEELVNETAAETQA